MNIDELDQKLKDDAFYRIELYDDDENELASYDSENGVFYSKIAGIGIEIDSFSELLNHLAKTSNNFYKRFVIELNLAGSDINARFDSEHISADYNRWGPVGPENIEAEEEILTSIFRSLSQTLKIEIRTLIYSIRSCTNFRPH